MSNIKEKLGELGVNFTKLKWIGDSDEYSQSTSSFPFEFEVSTWDEGEDGKPIWHATCGFNGDDSNYVELGQFKSKVGAKAACQDYFEKTLSAFIKIKPL